MGQRWGLTLPLPATPLGASKEQVKGAEAAGYTDFWSGETNGPDGFTPLALGAAWTERARLGTGVVGVFQRGPALLAQEAAALADASDGRFPPRRPRRRAHRDRLQTRGRPRPAGPDRAGGAARQDARPGRGTRRRG